jgi:hypothetical protein
MSDRRFRISQQHLNLLEVCPRKFQHTFLDRLNSPISPEKQRSMESGIRFHLLMQQRELGLDIQPLLQADPQVRQWFDDFVRVAPEKLQPDPLSPNPRVRQAESERAQPFLDYLLVGRYDLLVADNHCAQILDWKTYPRPQDPKRLETNWQTRLYLYLLVETSDYPPEAVSMTYWFVRSRHGEEPQCWQFSYSQQQHEQTRRDLNRLLSFLGEAIQNYQQGMPFEQVEESKGYCTHCAFNVRCQRDRDSPPPALSDLETIREIPL